MFARPVKPLTEKENITDDLKATDHMEWVRKI
jgi:hypothetical protein